MAFDGVVISNLVKDFKERILDGRIGKIVQPEEDELLLTIKKPSGNTRVSLSANPSLPLMYISEKNKQAPLKAPDFCMVLRKHILNGRIVAIEQPRLDRVVRFTVDHLDEMGDPSEKYLYMELMGKHSNIIFCDSDNRIIDAIKHIPSRVSSVREVLPGKDYFVPITQEKKNLLEIEKGGISPLLSGKPNPLYKAIYSSFYGLSPLISNEICFRAKVDPFQMGNTATKSQLDSVTEELWKLRGDISEGIFFPNIASNGTEPLDFSSIYLSQYEDKTVEKYDDISTVLNKFYASKEIYSRIRQKSTDLRKIVSIDLERNVRKYDLQLKQLKDTEKKEKYRVYGELLNAYGYEAKEGDEKIEVLNYYDNKKMVIPLDPTLSPSENSQKYFKKYNKMKRTGEALEELTLETKGVIDHLRSVLNFIEMAQSEADLSQIREELVLSGHIKKQRSKKNASKHSKKSKPYHYISSDGFDFYVGKNNIQNDELTFKFANGGDWWFHAKQMPGSHVVVKTNGQEMTDRAFEEAGNLAAYYSDGKNSSKVEIDYIQRKNVKKPSGANPGYVIYYTNYSLTAKPDISGLTLVEED